MNDIKPFTVTTVSTSGAPDIEFHFAGDTCRAECGGATLYAEARRPVYTDRSLGDAADLRVVDRDGEELACVIVNPRAHRNLTENITDVGSALLWSHWRYVQAAAVESSK